MKTILKTKTNNIKIGKSTMNALFKDYSEKGY